MNWYVSTARVFDISHDWVQVELDYVAWVFNPCSSVKCTG